MGNSCLRGCFFYLVALGVVVAVTAVGLGGLKGKFSAGAVQGSPPSAISFAPAGDQTGQLPLSQSDLRLPGIVAGGGGGVFPTPVPTSQPTAPVAPRVFTPVPSQGGTIVGEASQPFYVVQPGDSLWSIALRFGTNIDTLKTLNNLQTDTIYPGQLIYLPQASQPQGAPPEESQQSQMILPSEQAPGAATVIIPEMPSTGIPRKR